MTDFLNIGPGLRADNPTQVHGVNPTSMCVCDVDKFHNRTGWSAVDVLLPSSSALCDRGLSFDSGRGAVETQDCNVGSDPVICMATAALLAAGGWQEAGADHANSRKFAISKSLFRKPTFRKENPSISARIVMGSATHD